MSSLHVTKIVSNIWRRHGFPVLVYGTNTTQYVHHRFLRDNAAYRHQQADFGGKSKTLDLHRVRLGISNVLASSKNSILKLRDCCRLMNMTTVQTDKWTQRRFFGQIRLLSQAGYVRRIRVPGKQSGSLIMCVELLKEYIETDDFLLRKDRQAATQAEDDDDVGNDEDVLQAKEEDDDLDESVLAVPGATELIPGPQLTRDSLLELQIQQVVAQNGFRGTSGPMIRQRLVGDYWSRPFDEQIKRLAPDAASAIQPDHYSSLALGPPFEEILGKTHQYRYYTLRDSWEHFGGKDKNCRPVAPVDGKFPESNASEISSIFPPRCPIGEPQEHKQRDQSTKAKIKALTNPSGKRGRPTKAQVAARKSMEAMIRQEKEAQDPESPVEPLDLSSLLNASNPNQRPTASLTGAKRVNASSSAPVLPKKRKIQSTIQFPVTARQAQSQSSIHSPAEEPGPTEGDTIPDSKINSSDVLNSASESPQLIKVIPGRRQDPAKTQAPSPREQIRKSTTKLTSDNRKSMLMQLIESQGGIASLDVDFCNAYDKLHSSIHGVQHVTDRKTVKKALVELSEESRLHWMIKTLENHTGRAFTRRDIFFLSMIEPKSQTVRDFVEVLKAKEAQKKASTVGHKPVEVGPRPEMDIIPSVSQRLSHKASLRPLNLSAAELSQLRLRLSQKASTDAPNSQDTWYKGMTRLPNQSDRRRARKAHAASENPEILSTTPESMKEMQKPNLRRIVPKRPRTQRKMLNQDSGIRQSDTPGMLPPQAGVMPPPSALPSNRKTQPGSASSDLKLEYSGRPANSVSMQESSQGSTKRPFKRALSKRADRFEVEEDLQNPEDLKEELGATRRRHFQFTDEEDDLLVRAANLSMLFFSTSDLQPKIDWHLVASFMPHRDEDTLRRRYATSRNRPRHKIVQSFMTSTTFAQLYNEAVQKNELSPVPRMAVNSDNELFDLSPYVEFSRRFDPERRVAFTDPLPETIKQFHETHSITKTLNQNRHDMIWMDEFYTGTSMSIKANLLNANAFYISDPEEKDSPDPQEDHLIAAIKALLLTAENDYNAEEGSALLRRYGTEEVIESTLAAMMERNLVVAIKGDANRIIPGRNYQLAERFFYRLAPTIPYRTLKLASAFDNLLQRALGDNRTVLYPPLANNGTTVSSLELAIQGRIKIEQGQKHWGQHGLIHDYAVRQIDASVLDFDLILTRGQKGWHSETDTDMYETPKLPCFWIDIHGNTMDLVYHKTKSLLISFVVLRGRLLKSELFRLCSPVLTSHELDICLYDLIRAHRLREVDGLYEVTDRYYIVST